ncbi:MAG: hypothetical protein WB542_02215 [Polaromonas sp.]
MKPFVVKPAWAVMLLVAALMGNAHAKLQPTDAGGEPASGKTNKKAAKTAKAGHVGQIKFRPGSGETSRERSTRLKRECKGRVNAGACEGYTN